MKHATTPSAVLRTTASLLGLRAFGQSLAGPIALYEREGDKIVDVPPADSARCKTYPSRVPEIYGADQRSKKSGWMIRQAKSIGGK